MKSSNMKTYKHVIMVCFDALRSDCINASPRAYDFSDKYDLKFKLYTEELDKIFKKGIYFDNCITTAASTSISHASYFTGLWPKHHGIYEYFNRKLKKQTIFQFAQKNGYKTIFQTDFPIILGNYLGFDQGIDEYFIENEKAALKRLEQNKQNKTLSFFHFGGIHYPYGFHIHKFGGQVYVNKIEELENKYKISKSDSPHDLHDESNRSTFDLQLLARYKTILQKMHQQRLYDEIFKLYLEGINFFFKNRGDEFLRQIRDFADKQDALLVIFADHGEAWDENTFGHYNSLADEVLRVPLLFYGRDLKPGIEKDLVRTIDVAPTLFDAMQFDPADDRMVFDGKPLFPSVNAEKGVERYALAQFWHHGKKEKFIKHQRAVFAKKKLIKPMSNKLVAEVVYGDDLRLYKSYNVYDTVASRILEQKKSDSYVKVKATFRAAKIEKFLDDYNSDVVNQSKKIKTDSEIKKYLNDLGYNI